MQRHTSPPQRKVQGDSPCPPPPPHATHKNANNFTCFQSITSYLVHINFSLCRISPQSFQFVGQIVQLLYSLQNMFQYVIAVFNSSSHQLSGSCFCTLGPSDSPKGKHLGGFKLGECGSHSMSHLLLMSRSSNRCLSHTGVLLEV